MAAVVQDKQTPQPLYGEDVDYAVVGLGDSGRSVVDFLRARGASVRVFDTREVPPALAAVRQRHPEVEVITGGVTAEGLARAGELVLSPGFDPAHPALARLTRCFQKEFATLTQIRFALRPRRPWGAAPNPGGFSVSRRPQAPGTAGPG